MLFSIIVPIYNVEKYLPQCVESILGQDVCKDKYEVILVDDGSTDHSGQIVDQYAAQYPNIVPIHQINGGLSDARNSGLKVAKGEYTIFVDSDDYWSENVLSILDKKVAKKDIDVLQFSYQYIDEENRVYQPYKADSDIAEKKDRQYTGVDFLNTYLGYRCYAWQFVIKTSLLIDKEIFFKKGIYFEDTQWTPRMLLNAQSVQVVDTVVYNYRTRRGSITQSIQDDKKKKLLTDMLSLIDNLIQQSQNLNKAQVKWFQGMISRITISVLDYATINYYSQRRKYLLELNNKGVYPLSFYQTSKREKRKIWMINLNPNLYCYLIHCRNLKNN